MSSSPLVPLRQREPSKVAPLLGALLVPTGGLVLLLFSFAAVPAESCESSLPFDPPSAAGRAAYIAFVALLSLVNVGAAGIVAGRIRRESGRKDPSRPMILVAALALVGIETALLSASGDLRYALGLVFIPSLVFAVLPWLGSLIDVLRGRGLVENNHLVVICMLTSALVLYPDIARWHLHHLTRPFCLG